MKQKLKVRWAFDPFADHVETWDRAIEFLYLLQEETNAEITPTYILGSELTDWVGYLAPNRGIDIYNGAQEACLEKLQMLDRHKTFQEPEVIRSPALSRRSDALSMAESMIDFDLLLINSHAKKGLQRFIMGSFAENVLLKSQKPIVFISPNTKPISKIEKTFFPTDLTVSSRVVFNAYLNKSFNTSKEIILYSKIAHPATAFVSSSSMMLGGGPITLDQYFSDHKETKNKEVSEWEKNATSAGFKVESVIDDNPVPFPDCISQVALEKKCDMIVMPSFASQLDSILVGSEARKVIRQSTIPVLVWPAKRDDDKVTLY